mmetsp:Transcript_26688/g.63241  ORF Transcript_26688/g.63241 Transcript_26688/m.63241 type:complete len:316 (+) Transcript_26688:801-1748(+)
MLRLLDDRVGGMPEPRDSGVPLHSCAPIRLRSQRVRHAAALAIRLRRPLPVATRAAGRAAHAGRWARRRRPGLHMSDVEGEPRPFRGTNAVSCPRLPAARTGREAAVRLHWQCDDVGLKRCAPSDPPTPADFAAGHLSLWPRPILGLPIERAACALTALAPPGAALAGIAGARGRRLGHTRFPAGRGPLKVQRLEGVQVQGLPGRAGGGPLRRGAPVEVPYGPRSTVPEGLRRRAAGALGVAPRGPELLGAPMRRVAVCNGQRLAVLQMPVPPQMVAVPGAAVPGLGGGLPALRLAELVLLIGVFPVAGPALPGR